MRGRSDACARERLGHPRHHVRLVLADPVLREAPAGRGVARSAWRSSASPSSCPSSSAVQVDLEASPCVRGPRGGARPSTSRARPRRPPPSEEAARRGGRARAIREAGHGRDHLVHHRGGPRGIKVGTHVDGFTVVMLFIVALISLLVHVFSTNYMHDDVRYTHYFAVLGLFTTGMLRAGTASTTLADAVRLGADGPVLASCSSATGGRRRRTPTPPSRRSSPPARVTSACWSASSILFFAAGQTFDIAAHQRAPPSRARSPRPPSLVAGVGPARRRDRQVGPVPAAHLAARRHGRPHAGVGADPRRHHGRRRRLPRGPPLRRVLGGLRHRRRRHQPRRRGRRRSRSSSPPLLAFVQRDIKKVLAYSTVSQLGYMVMALGVGAWTAAIFHLFTHAFFKAPAVPRLRLGEPRRAQLRHEEGHGRPAEAHADHLRHVHDRLASPWPASSRSPASGRRTRSSSAPRRTATSSSWSSGLVGAFMTARLHDPLRVPHVLRRVPRPRPPARVAARHHRAADRAGRVLDRRRLPQLAVHRRLASPT